jgi:hypothetical protein
MIADDEIEDLKIFEHLPDALARFRMFWFRPDKDECDSIALFRVSNVECVRHAAEAIRSGNKSCVELLKIKESLSRRQATIFACLREDSLR